jgi:hypothetical protein
MSFDVRGALGLNKVSIAVGGVVIADGGDEMNSSDDIDEIEGARARKAKEASDSMLSNGEYNERTKQLCLEKALSYPAWA